MSALQHKFGLASVFITVTLEDRNTFLVECYSQQDVNGFAIDPMVLTSQVLKERAALNFEYALAVVIKEVIGWNVETHQPMEYPGMFGVPCAFGGRVEEQGRSLLHVNFTDFLDGFDTYVEILNAQNSMTQTGSGQRYIHTPYTF
mmetsp:Transcript_27225/g.75103  ORF Transcript_27225/g.75103 Transcript_27225/m.75103 type:complete len:145 (+) Transcript_27225:566-1000(+)